MLLRIKGALLRFYAEFDTYLTALLKFALAFAVLFFIGRKTGYFSFPGQTAVLLIAAAFCSFLPANTLIFIAAAWLESQFFGHSLAAAIVGGVLLFVFLLLYFCFAPGHPYVAVLTAMLASLGIPLAVPVVCALLMGPGALGGIVLGGLVCYSARGLFGGPQGGGQFDGELLDQALGRFRALFLQTDLIVTLVALTAAFLTAWILRRLAIRYSWTVAVFLSVFVYAALEGMGVLFLQAQVSLPQFIADLALALAAGSLVRFFRFHVDYRKVEYLQFEDDDYYYYVKAVAKIGVGGTGKGEEDDRL